MSETRGDVTGGGLAEAVLALADEWSEPRSLRANAWLRERDAADRLRAAVAAATAETPETPPTLDAVSFPVRRCDVTEHHGGHTYDYDGPITWCEGVDQ